MKNIKGNHNDRDTKRIFVAVMSSARIKSLVREWRAGHKDLPVRWVAEDNLHITLIAPWEDDDVQKAVGKLEKIRGRVKPFEIRFEKVACGPDPRRPRLIWAQAAAGEKPAILQREVVGLLGAKPQDHEFKPHLTLARFRAEDYARLPKRGLSEKVLWPERVEAVCLVESILKPEGAKYEILRKIDL